VKWIIWLMAATALAQTPAELQRASVAKQREAAQKQTMSVGPKLKSRVDPIAPFGPDFASSFDSGKPVCDALADIVATPIIDGAAQNQGVDIKLLRAVIEQESGFKPCAVSPKGAQGLMQLMPAVAAQFNVADPFDPQQSVEAGSKYLKQLMDKYPNDLPRALAAYNAGPAATDQAKGIPDIPETKAYVEAILQKLGIKRTDPPNSPTPKPIEN